MTLRVAVIAGDGAGPEVVAEARKAVDALGLELSWQELPWGTAYYREHGAMMPPDALDTVRQFDAVLLGAVGDPSVPDHVTLWGLLLPLRQGLDLWANLRPARLLEGVPSKLASRELVDMLFVRENTEGEYSGVGGRAHRGLELEVGIETSVFTRAGVRRVVKYAFELAEQRKGVVTSATKSNASRYGYVLWDEIAEEVAAEHPDVKLERVLVDALAARMISDPAGLDVVVASNLFGDVLTDIAAVLQGGMGMAASASIAPGSATTPIFEPVHGSAPAIAGLGIANPIGAVWSAALLLEHLGEATASTRLMDAVEAVCREGPRTGDIGGDASTSEVGDAIARRVADG
jgi:tartrate dehydrogenase/decarboxylase/D-malate dehydrogenase